MQDTTTETFQTALNNLWSRIDASKITDKSTLAIGDDAEKAIFVINYNYKSPLVLAYSRSEGQTTGIIVSQIVISQNSSVYRVVKSDGTVSDETNNVIRAIVPFTITY